MANHPRRGNNNLHVHCIEGQKGDSWIYHIQDGFYYHLSFERNGTQYLKCIFNCVGCIGRAVIHPQRGFRHTQGHADMHGPDMLLGDVKTLRNNILERCRSLADNASFRDIIQQERQGFEEGVKRRLPYVKIRLSMIRARHSMYPPIPQTLEELTAILSDPQYQVITRTLDGEDNIYAGSVQTEGRFTHIVFSSKRQLRLLRRCNYIFSDGTFDVVPAVPALQNNRSAQVFVIVTSWRGHTIPIAWAIMENRTQRAYEGVIGLIFRILRGRIHVDNVVTDHEWAQHQAWGVYLDARLQDCLFHMDRRMVRRIQDTGLGEWFHNEHAPEFTYIIRLACSLPLLPADFLITGWRMLKREARNVGGNMLRNLLNPFFDYVWDQFIASPVIRDRVSVFDSEHRTNNCVESANRGLNRLFGPHPSIYDFIGGLVRLEDLAYVDFLTLDSGMEASRARRTSAIRNDQALRRLGRDLMQAPFGDEDAVIRYMRAASHRVENLVNNLAGIAEEVDQNDNN